MDTTLYEEWLLAQGLEASTVNIYRGKLLHAERITVMQGWDLKHMSASQLGSLATNFSESTRSTLRYALTHYWQLCGVSNPAKAILAPKPPPPEYRGLEAAEASAIERVAVGWWPQGSVVMLGLYLGLRCSEMAAVRFDCFDHDLTRARIVGKGRRTRFLPVHDRLREDLASRIGDGYLFPGSAGRAYVHSATIAAWVKEVARTAGVTLISPHGLRHTCLTTLYEETGDLKLVQDFAGHADPKTTERYTLRANEDRMRKAVGRSFNYRQAT